MSVAAMDIVEHTGITYRQLDHWTSSGYLNADNNRPGNGHHRRYPDTEHRIADLMARLVTIGMAPAQAAVIGRASVERGVSALDLPGDIRIVFKKPKAGDA